MAKWLRRLGHQVTVLTTSAYGRLTRTPSEGVVRTADLQRLRARLHGRDRVDALFDSDTYSGRPHPSAGCSSPSRWSPPGRRSRVGAALRLNRARPVRLRDHELAARVRARRRPGASPARRPLGRRPPRRLDVRADPPALSHRGSSAASTSGSSAAGSAPPTRSSASAAPPPRTCASGSGSTPALIPNGWDPDLSADAGGRRRGGSPPRPRADLARLHGPLRQLRPRSGRPLIEALRAAGDGATRTRRRGSSW